MSTAQKARMPKGIPYIIGNEAAERFSFYGMKAILSVFMTQYLVNSSGALDLMPEHEASYWYHIFIIATYGTPILGALLSDIFLGKYKTIIGLSIVYCLGHLALALDETRMGLTIGLTLIAIGSGGIKPCVSAHVGDQFGKDNSSLINRVFNYFYLSINFGSFVATLITPLLLKEYGPHVAFGLPGLLMLLATIVFYIGRHEFISVKAAGWAVYKRDLFSKQGLKALGNMSIIYFVFISFFWSLFDQTGSTWVFQAKRMDKLVDLGFWQFELLPSQIQAVNPILILTLIPVFTFLVYPFIEKRMKFSLIKRIMVGLFLAAIPFAICAMVEQQLVDGGKPSIIWQFVAYIFLTIAEILVSISALEFAYTQAPNTMKSFITSFYLLSVMVGNMITVGVTGFIIEPLEIAAVETGAKTYVEFKDEALASDLSRISFEGAAGLEMPDGSGLQGTFFLAPAEGNRYELLDANKESLTSVGTFAPQETFAAKFSKLDGAKYFWFFAGAMFAVATLFVFVAMWYKEEFYIQTEEDYELPDPSVSQN